MLAPRLNIVHVIFCRLSALEGAMFSKEKLRGVDGRAALARVSSPSKSGNSSGGLSALQLTRRSVLGVAASATVAGAALWVGILEAQPLRIERTRSGAAVFTGPYTWYLSRESFGQGARFTLTDEPDHHSLVVRNVRFPGTDRTFDLSIRFRSDLLGASGGWRMDLTGGRFPVSTSVAFVPWLLGQAEAVTNLDDVSVADLLWSVTRGEVSGRSQAQLLLLPNLTWQLRTETGSFSTRLQSFRARKVTIATAAAKEGVFDSLMDELPSVPSTTILFEGGSSDDGIEIGAGVARETLRLVPSSLPTICVQTFETPRPTVVTGMRGAFTASVQRQGVECGGIEAAEGLVLWGRRAGNSFRGAIACRAEDRLHRRPRLQ
jgi:hypothetical protein